MNHPTIPPPGNQENTTLEPPLINTATGVAECLAHLASQSRVAVDTEADSLHCYFEKLCLLQISVPGADFLVDPLADVPLESLLHQLAAVEIVLHGADYDLRLLRRIGFPEPRAVFDTMIAARLVGLTEFSLGSLVTRFFGIVLPKGSQKANWARRPLSPVMLAYARNDTHYLLEIAQQLEAELNRLGRWEWFQQSCERAIAVTRGTKVRDLDSDWRITGSSDLRGRAAALLRALWRWRDAEAQAVDRPPFHILQNSALIEAAREFDAGGAPAPRHLEGGRKRRFLEAAAAALQSDESEWPKVIRNPRLRPTHQEEQRFKELRTKRDAAAARLQLDPALIAPKATLEALAMNFESTLATLLPWQQELLR